MGWLANIFGAVPKRDLQGLCLGNTAFWTVTPTTDFPAFLDALVDLAPPGSILYIEGDKPPEDLGAFFAQRCVPETVHLVMGTIWPRPRTFHLPITEQNIRELAALIRQKRPSGSAVHLHVYRDNEVLLEWHDAFWRDPFYLSASIEEDRLRTFCERLGVKYERTRKTDEPGR